MCSIQIFLDKLTQDYLKPCFPGKCQGASSCTCADGFGGPNCIQSKYTDKTNISDTNVRHINIY
jgi:hypothetical protein